MRPYISMDIELRNDRIPRNPFDRQFLDMDMAESEALSEEDFIHTSFYTHAAAQT